MNPEIISNIKPFINKYNWDKIKYPSKIDDWKIFEKEMEIFPVYISKYNTLREKNYPFNGP